MKISSFIKNQKAQSEILSYSLVVLIIIVILAVLISFLLPSINKQNSIENFKISQSHIDKINSQIINVLGEPTGSTTKLQLNLDKLYLNLNSSENKIYIYQIIDGDFYDKTKTTKYGNIHTYRDGQKLYICLEYDNNIDLTGDFSQQEGYTDLYFTKTAKNQVRINTQIVNYND
jgi:uncharacterized protein (UPF0333 family)